MSELQKKTIEELRVIIRKDFGRVLSFSEASQIAHGLVGYFNLLAKINHKNNYEKK